jgi:hypothetical protein
LHSDAAPPVRVNDAHSEDAAMLEAGALLPTDVGPSNDDASVV